MPAALERLHEGQLLTGATLKVRGCSFTGFHGALLDGRPVGAVRIVTGDAVGQSRLDLGDPSFTEGHNEFQDNSTDLSIETPYVPQSVLAAGNTWSQEPICDGAILRLADPDEVWISIGGGSACILPL